MDNWFWEIYQQRNIRKAGSDARKASIDTGKLQNETLSLESQLDHLSLICRAMWDLIKYRTDLTEKDLIDRVEELDMADGQKDNKFRDVRECYSCGKTLGPKYENCIYCGVKAPISSAFNKL